MKKEEEKKDMSRRDFVGGASKAAAALAVAPMIVPRHVLGKGYRAPSDTLNFVSVGIGGMGMENLRALLKGGENLVAIVDVDFPYVERSLGYRTRQWKGKTAEQEADAQMLQSAYTKAVTYADFRQMLDKQKDFDGVVVATPDFMHATIAHAAMLHGKHVYVQKPLTYTVYEARLLARTAAEQKVVTQMGNQGHSFDGTRRINELIAAGVIGPVKEVHIWTDRPQRFWAQGIPRPYSGQPTPPATLASQQPAVPRRWSMKTVDDAVLASMNEDPHTPPEGLHWDLFQGCGPDVAYHPVYHPFSWRGWPGFGVSAIGDMGAHLIDQPFWSLGLDYPTSIVTTSTPWGSPNGKGSYPLAMTISYEFAARGSQPPVKLFWYDGGLVPPVAADVPAVGGDGGGGIFIGEKGYLTYETYGNNPRVFPDSLAAEAAAVPKTFPRVTVPHEINWAQACKGLTTASSPFSYASKLTETMLLGMVAREAGEARKVLYDGANMRVTNIPEANAYLTREYRKGWEL